VSGANGWNKLFKILEYRNDENLTRNGVALHKDIETLRDIAYHAKRENETLVKLAEQSRKDGRALKALSVLGTLYLPATFIAVCPFPSMSIHRKDH